MKLKALAAILATCEAVHNEQKQIDSGKLIGTKYNKQKALTIRRLIGLKEKVECAAMDPMLLQVQAQAKAKAKAEEGCGDDSCCGCCCCSSPPPSTPTYNPPTIPIPVPTNGPCPTGQALNNGVCTTPVVPNPLAPSCPSGFQSDGMGSCFTIVTPFYPTNLPAPTTCALGFHDDGRGGCISNTPIPQQSPSCSTGYKYAGNGICVTIHSPIVCDSNDGFTSDGQGGCIPITVVTKLTQEPSPSVGCPSGYISDGQGNCVPNNTTLTSCASGFTSDGQGSCIWIVPPGPNPPSSPTVPTCQSGYHEDGYGNCVKSFVPDICSYGYTSDGFGNCVSIPTTPSYVPTIILCPEGYHSDGNGNCIQSNVILTCQEGFETDGQGGCVPTNHFSSTISVPCCPDGQISDGDGGCISAGVTTFCEIGYVSDENGNCISIPPPVTPPSSSVPSSSVCPCQGAIDELQAEINVLEAALESVPLSVVSSMGQQQVQLNAKVQAKKMLQLKTRVKQNKKQLQ